ncbi:MAG: C40 family peptidase [Tepidimonas sp.]|uniref:C40 family peptidase n=1 Tax=Tepidimonas sp. TaxID=2002775 RepID=UPI00405518A9
MELLLTRGLVSGGAPWVSGQPTVGDGDVVPATRGSDGWGTQAPPVVADDAQARRSAALVYAMAYVGVPYQRGGVGFEQGVDCSGFVQITYRDSAGIRLPRRAAEQAQATLPIAPRDLAPGDLVFFNTQGEPFSHVGIYVGQGRFIHSPRTGARVRIERLEDRYWREHFDGARRVIGDANG